MTQGSPEPVSHPAPDQPEPRRAWMTRRHALQAAGAGVVLVGAGSAATVALARPGHVSRIEPGSPEVRAAERARVTTGRTVGRQLTAQPSVVDLAGRQVRTSTYGGDLPAREIRAEVGDRLRVDMANQLTQHTTVHWHGLALRNDMDGVPGVTMASTAPGAGFRYDYTLPQAGTYWFHPHYGVQLDTGLMGALVIEDPHEPLVYDEDVVLLLDDWTDGVGPSPAQNLRNLAENGMGDMGGMSASGTTVDADHPLGTDTGDVVYPLHLVNGHAPADPFVVASRPGRRIRFRLINAGADTAYRFAIGGHRLLVVAADGYPVTPVEVDTLILGMGERYDVLVTVGDGAFPILSSPEGKQDPVAFAVLRSSTGSTPAPTASELTGQMLTYADLQTTASSTMSASRPDVTLPVVVKMVDGGRTWTINDRTWSDHVPLDVHSGQRVRLVFDNQTSMFHPMHLHGHTYAVVGGGDRPGLRKDTLNVLPRQKVSVDVEADNPGQWLLHCHNLYHGELGMMTLLSYIR